nr:MAG TPA: hypothetical protein [Caudoviricetes sp.]
MLLREKMKTYIQLSKYPSFPPLYVRLLSL